MAKPTPITRLCANEDPLRYTPSTISRLFSRYLTHLGDVIERERDIAEVDIWDPAFRDWLTAAERARDAMADIEHMILNAPPMRPADKPLKLAAFLIHLTRLCETPQELRRYRKIARDRGHEFLLSGNSATERRVNAMLCTALVRFEAFVTLDMGLHMGDDFPTV